MRMTVSTMDTEFARKYCLSPGELLNCSILLADLVVLVHGLLPMAILDCVKEIRLAFSVIFMAVCFFQGCPCIFIDGELTDGGDIGDRASTGAGAAGAHSTSALDVDGAAPVARAPRLLMARALLRLVPTALA